MRGRRARLSLQQRLAKGAARDSYDYDAWGNTVDQTGSMPNLYRYRGEQYDPDLNLYYLRARYFNPLTGRFLTRDPASGDLCSPQTLHKYLFVGGDPVNAVDPSGRGFLEQAIMAMHWVSWYAYQAKVVILIGGTYTVVYGSAVIVPLCRALNILARAALTWPPGAPGPGGVPVWPTRPVAALCTAFGM